MTRKLVSMFLAVLLLLSSFCGTILAEAAEDSGLSAPAEVLEITVADEEEAPVEDEEEAPVVDEEGAPLVVGKTAPAVDEDGAPIVVGEKAPAAEEEEAPAVDEEGTSVAAGEEAPAADEEGAPARSASPEEPSADDGEAALMDAVPEGYIGVFTKDDLYEVRSNPTGKYIQMADIEFTEADFAEGGDFYNMGMGWEPIGTSSTPFQGSYDGNGYAIRGLTINSTENYRGLFGYACKATFLNIALEEVDIAGKNNVGGIVGYVTMANGRNNYGNTRISECSVTGSVNGTDHVGGIIGRATSTYEAQTSTDGTESYQVTVERSRNEATVSGKNYVGGICGGGEGKYIQRGGSKYHSIVLENCYNVGNVSGTDYVGGVVGACGYQMGLRYVYSIGDITAVSIYGGVAGSGSATYSYYLNSGVTNPTNEAGTAKDASGLKRQGTYEQWDFDSVWTMEGDGDYAYAELRCFCPAGTVRIVGDVIYDASLTVDVSEAQRLKGYTVAWVADGEPVGTGDPFTVPAAAVGKSLAAVVTSTDSFYRGSLTSPGVIAGKAPCVAVPLPGEVLDKSTTAVLINAISGQEYCLDGVSWQTSGAFSGLEPGTSYTVYTRMAENATYLAGEGTEAVTFTTERQPIGGRISITGTAQYTRELGLNTELLTPAGATFTCQWRRGETVLGEGERYTLTAEDIGEEITVVLTATWQFIGALETPAVTAAPCDIAVVSADMTSSFTYSREAFTPMILLKNGSLSLRRDTDYTLEYRDNVNVGTATVLVTGIGNYQGTKELSFTIQPQTLELLSMAAVENAYYTGAAIEPALTILHGSYALEKGTDYTVALQNNVELGEASLTVTGVGNYSGSLERTFQILSRPLTEAEASLEQEAYVYTAAPVEPAVTVTAAGRVLSPGTDYTLEYRDNVNVGTAAVLVTGLGNYQGTTELRFAIQPLPLEQLRVAELPEAQYTGAVIEPELSILHGSYALVKGADYTVAFRDNVELGEASLTVTGIGNYGGSLELTFRILSRPLSEAETSLEQEACAYTAAPVEPAVTVTAAGRVLSPGTDYTLEYRDNVNVGSATALVTGIGNYEGTRELRFAIQPLPLEQLSAAALPEADYTGAEIEPELSILHGSYALVKGTDYTVAFRDNVAPGEAALTVTGIGNYGGSLELTFRILARSLTEAVVSTEQAEYSYTGSPVEPAVTVTLEGRLLTLGTDYALAYDNNLLEGEAAVIVTGVGGYTDTARAAFRISGHLYGDWITETEASCTEPGLKYQLCSGCGDRVEESIPALGHDYREEVVPPTATEQGYTLHTCSRCNDSYRDAYTEPVPCVITMDCCTVTVRSYRAAQIVAAAYEASGRLLTTMQKPTGPEEGEYSLTFADLSEVSLVKVFYLDSSTYAPLAPEAEFQRTPGETHTYTSRVLTQATCEREGVMEYSCVRGDYSYTEAIPKAAHTPVTDRAVAASCTAAGLSEGSHCAVCGTVLVAQKTTPKAEHTPVTDRAVAATCTAAGLSEGSHCAVCGTVLVSQKATPKAEHTPVTDRAVAATCTAAGLSEGSHCAVCGIVLVAQTVRPATGEHTYSGGLCTVCAEKQPITSLTISQATASLAPLKTLQLSVTPAPAAANQWTTLWYTSDNSVATVSSRGLVTAVRPGTAQITAVCGGKSASCTVTVTGTQAQATYAFLADFVKTNYQSLRDGVYYYFEGSGNRTYALIYDPGAKQLTLGYMNTSEGSGISMIFIPESLSKPYDASLSFTSTSGVTLKGLAHVDPAKLSDDSRVSFSSWSGTSSNRAAGEQVLTSGLLIAVIYYEQNLLLDTPYSLGDLGFTGIPLLERSHPIAVSGVSLSSTEITMDRGDTRSLSATVSPSTAWYKSCTWYSSNEGVVRVSDGRLVAGKAGTATVYVVSGGKIASCRVTVR